MLWLTSWLRSSPDKSSRGPARRRPLAATRLEDRLAPAILFSEDFSDNAAGWALGAEWQIGPAALSTGQSTGYGDPAQDHTPTGDNGVAGVRIGGNAATTVHDYYYLTSPAIDTSAASSPVTLEFYRWLNSDYTPYMANRVEVFNGSSWQIVWQTGSTGIQDNTWQRQQFDVSPYKNANMRVRFGFNVGSSGVFTMSSWNIDDVTVTSADAQPPANNGLAVQIVGAPSSSPEGTTVTLASTVTDTGGGAGPYTYAWSVTKNGAAYTAGTPTTGPGFTFTPDDNGVYVVSLAVTAPDGRTTSGTTAAPTADVLIIADSSPINTYTQSLKNALEAAGFNVAVSPAVETLYNGTNPYLTPYEAVIHLDGITWSSPMPATGQQALNSYVQTGGAYLGSEWISYEAGSHPYMRDLILFDYGGEAYGTVTYADVTAQAGHPVLANVPSSFTFQSGRAYTTAHTFATNPVTVLMTDQTGRDAVAVRDFGSGRVVEFNHSGNYSGYATLADPNVQQLYVDGVKWAARLGSGGGGGGGSGSNAATITVTNVAPSATLSTDGPVTELTPVTLTFSNVTDPSPVDTTAGFRYSFSTSTGGLATSYAAAGPSPTGQISPLDDGNVLVYARVFDKDGGFRDYPTTVTVINVAPTATVSNGGPVAEGSPATVSLTNPVDSTADLGLGLHYSFATSSAGLAASYAAAGTANSQQFTFPDNGSYTVFARVFDGDGAYTDYQTTVTVTNVAPTVTITGGPANSPEGTAITLGSTVTDPGTADTFTYSWGVTKNGVAYATGTPTNAATFTFTPDDNGTYVVNLTVTDDDGGVGVGNSVGGPTDVLIVYDSASAAGTTDLRNALQVAGFNVSLSSTSETLYTGTNPSLASYEAVVHLNGTTWASDMPLLGQQALVGFVQNGGGYLGSEWNAWEFSQGRLQGMRDLILLNSVSYAYATHTLTDVAGQSAHPLLANVPASFTLTGYANVGQVRAYATQPATVLMRDQGGNDAVAVRQLGAGRVVAFHNTGNYTAGTLSDPEVLQLYVDGVRWAAKPVSSPGATITVTNAGPALAGVTVTPSLVEGGTATLTGRVVDPGTGETYTVTVSWGDGTTSTAPVAADRTFSATHVYADDDPSGTPADVYRVGVTVSDGAATGGAGVVELVSNGGFETGTFAGWTVTAASPGQWVINGGAFDPDGPGLATAPISGQFDALATQTGPATQFLSAPIAVPANVTSAVLSWSDRVRNHAGAFSDPNQEWRVRVLGPTGAVLREVYSTNPGDPLQPTGATRRSFDLTPFLQGLTGQTIRLSFELQNNLFYFNVNLDDVSLLVGSGPDLAVTVANAAPTLADVAITPAAEGGPVTLTGRVVDPGMRDTHTVTIAWGDGTSSAATLGADRTFTASHVYRDDNPTGTPADVYQVGIAVRDDDGGTGGTGAQELVTNGGFENGFAGWTAATEIADPQTSRWVINTGAVDPDGPGTSTAPISGTADALATQSGPSRLLLSAPIVVPSGITAAVLSWSDRVRNHAGAFSDPNQEWRVRVLDGAGGVLATVFSTNPGDPLQQVGPNRRSADLTAFLQGRAGQTIRLSFELEDNLFYFNVNLDDVSLLVGTGPGLPVTVSNVAPTAPDLQVSPAVGEDGTVVLTGTFTDAGVDDTHTVTVNWGDGSQTVLGGGATVPVSEAVEYNGHRYYVVRQQGLSWFDAQEQAQRLGGNLATINDAAENSFVSELLRQNFGYYALAWIGLNDERSEGQFGWASGESTTYTNWFVQDGEPNDYPPQVTEDFAITNYAYGYGPGWWNDLSGTRDSGVYWGAYAVVEVSPTRTFTLSHRYADDTAADAYTIGVTVTDDDTGTATATATATVTNSAPANLTVAADAVTINEDGSVTLTGSFTDLGTLDSHTVTIDWEDGTTSQVMVPAFAGMPSAGINLAASAEFGGHTYHFVSTPLSWDAAEAEARRMGGHLVTINSAAENVFLLEYVRRSARTGDVQTWIGLSDGGTDGPFRWASGEPLAYTAWAAGEPGNPAGPTGIAFNYNNTQIGARWGDFAAGTPLYAVIEVDGKRTFSATHHYLDDNPTGTPSDVYPIGVTVTDDDGGGASVSVPVTVANVAPALGSLTGPVAGVQTVAPPTGAAVPFSGVRGQPLAFSTAFSDVGTRDTHEVRWDFGDGTVSAWIPASGYVAAAPTHVYTAAGTYAVTVSVRDDDGGVVSFARPVEVKTIELQADPNDPTKTTLVVGGTTGNDVIELAPGPTAGSIETTVNGVSLGTYTPTGSLTAYAQAGNDDVAVAGGVSLPAWLHGGAGNDRLKGGSGHDVLLGGDGDDLLVGGVGRDFLIAGAGADRAVGNAEDDVLIAGSTLYDDDRMALGLLRGVWLDQEQTYEQRVAALRSADTLPGGVRLAAGTVFADDAADVLTGAGGQDWFVFDSTRDRVTDVSDAAFDPDRDFLDNP